MLEIPALKKKEKPTRKCVSVRLMPQTAAALEELAKANGVSVSSAGAYLITKSLHDLLADLQAEVEHDARDDVGVETDCDALLDVTKALD